MQAAESTAFDVCKPTGKCNALIVGEIVKLQMKAVFQIATPYMIHSKHSS